MNKKTISYTFLSLFIICILAFSAFKLSNVAHGNINTIYNLQTLEKIAEAGDIEAQLRLIDFYQKNINSRNNYKVKLEYLYKKVEAQKSTDEYKKVNQKLAEERQYARKEAKKIREKKMAELAVFSEQYKNIDPKDKEAQKRAHLRSLEIVNDRKNVYSWKEPYTLRYRLTVNIKTPEGIKSGSTVQGIHYPLAFIKNTYNPASKGIPNGEAAYIDLGERGVIFAIMPAPSSARHRFFGLIRSVFPTVPTVYGQYRYKEVLHHYNDLRNVKDEISSAHYPMLIRFRDINDPQTIEVVYQVKRGETIDRIEEVFGQGVSIESMFLEMTDDPLEWKLDNKLSWIETMEEKDITHALRKAEPHVHITNSVAYYVFRQGFKK
ncbi:MAG: hypothetical protein COB36_01710 [Alphaproteobacteria bacterium]|nr:MAG: hypothetical protein COB36_01710 [Alphaproteobacteria bacterium]